MTDILPGNVSGIIQISSLDRLCEHKVGSNISVRRLDLLPDVEHEGYKDGGVKAWMAVFGAFIALFCTFGQMSAFGTFQAWYQAHQFQHFHPSTIAWIGSLQLFVFFFSGALIGRMFDRYGPFILMALGMILYVSSMVVTSVATKFYQYILFQGVLLGLGVGMIFYPSLACISTHFLKYRATAIGIAASGSSVGGVIYPIMLQYLFKQIGFGWTLRISALVSGVCCLFALATVTRRHTAERSSGPWIDMAVFKDARFALLTTGCFFVALGLFIPFFYITDYARDQVVPQSVHLYSLALMNLGGVLGRIIPARLADTVGHFAILTPAAFLSGLACLALWLPAHGIGLLVFAAIYGFFSGTFVAVVTPCVAGMSEIGQIGTRIGMLYSIISFPSLLGGPTAGALLIKMNGSYTGMIVFSGTTIIVGSLFILLAKLQVDSRILARV